MPYCGHIFTLPLEFWSTGLVKTREGTNGQILIFRRGSLQPNFGCAMVSHNSYVFGLSLLIQPFSSLFFSWMLLWIGLWYHCMIFGDKLALDSPLDETAKEATCVRCWWLVWSMGQDPPRMQKCCHYRIVARATRLLQLGLKDQLTMEKISQA